MICQGRPLLRRSALYVPASNKRAMERAGSLGSDVVIIDLEDAVAPGAKKAAREEAHVAIASGRFASATLVLRVNSVDTPWGLEDLEMALKAAPAAILAPKVSSQADAPRYAAQLSGTSIGLWAMIETCRGAMAVGEIAATSAVDTLVFGTNDLAAEMGASLGPQREPLAAAMAMTVMAAKAYGLGVLDGVYNAVHDAAGFEAECRQGVAFGFDGKTLIHPAQIEICNRTFSPGPAEVAAAKAVVEAFNEPDAKDKAVLLVDGRMTERLHLTRALRTLAIHEAASKTQAP